MKKTLIALAAAGMLASPILSAQPYHREQPSAGRRTIDGMTARRHQRARVPHQRPYQRGIDEAASTSAKRAGSMASWDIESKERDYMNDGRLNRRETDALNHDLDRLTDHVRQQIRD